MHLLIVAATDNEILPFLNEKSNINSHEIKHLVTGVGMVATTFCLTQYLSENKVDLVINVGIAGAFNKAIKIGEVVEIITDRFSEIGAEDNSKFLAANEIGLINENDLIFHSKHHFKIHLPKYEGISVNKVHGNSESIAQIINKFNPDVESMEGAAVFYVCNKLEIPCVQIRAISNFVEPRNKENWNIPLAIENLNSELKNLIKNI